MINTRKKKILIIEDETEFAQLIKSRLEVNRFQVLTAEDGRTGLQEIIFQKPDLVILDIMMPGMGGYELCQRIKGSEELAHVPIVLLTARRGDLDKQMGMECGADSYVPKPHCAELLLGEVNRLLASNASA